VDVGDRAIVARRFAMRHSEANIVNAKAGKPANRRPKSGAEKQLASQSSCVGSREHPAVPDPLGVRGVRDDQKGSVLTDSRSLVRTTAHDLARRLVVFGRLPIAGEMVLRPLTCG
jgi:hypothetical protein